MTRNDPPGAECKRADVVCGVRVGEEGVEAGDDVRVWRGRRGCGRWRVAICARSSACCASGRRAVWRAGAGAGRELLRSRARWVLDSSGAAALGVANRVVDSSSIEVNRRARRAKTDRLDALKLVQMLVRVVVRRADGVERSARADRGGRSGAPGESERTALTQEQTRLVNQMRGWLATWGATLPRARRGRVVDDGARLGGRGRCPRPCKRGWRAPSARLRAWCRRRSRRSTPQQQAAVAHRAGRPVRVRAVGPAQRGGDDQRVGAARRRPGVARVPESTPDWRPARLCADAV